MYFYKLKGRQMLDLRGDLILTHNAALVTARIKSAAPSGVRNSAYIANVTKLTLRGRIAASWAALRFIWTRKSQALTADPGGNSV